MRVRRFAHLFLPLLLIGICIPAQAQDYVPGQVLVKLRSHNVAAGVSLQMHKIVEQKYSEKAQLQKAYLKLGLQKYQMKSGQNMQEFMNDIGSDPNVEYVEPDFILKKINDPREEMLEQTFSAQDVREFATSQAGSYTQSMASTKVSDSWNIMTSSTLVTPVVAVIDTGVDYNHEIFANTNAIWQNPGETGIDAFGRNKATNGIDDDNNGFVDDVRGWNFYSRSNNPMDDDEHGTHVAGIVLGISQDIFASSLQPAKIKIMPLKFLGANGSGSTSDAIDAIYYAVNNGAQVINNSWGGSNYSQALHDAMKYAYDHRVTVISAAGNYHSDNDASPLYPANYPVPGALAIAATNDYDSLASFSNYGKQTVHLAAPGYGILSSVPGNSYRFLSGTSMASPFVAGMAAMVVREAPQLSAYQVRNIILGAVNTVSGLSLRISSSGRANEYNTVLSAQSSKDAAANQPVYVASGGARAPASADMGKSGCGTVSKLGSNGLPTQNPLSGWSGILFTLSFALPLCIWFTLRRRDEDLARRKHPRFIMNSEIQLKVGSRELTGQMKTISEGGLSFNADSMLEKGGIVTMTITSPDGREQVQVQGQIVWSEQNSAYGVQFDHAKEGVLASIRNWTGQLLKAR